MVRPVGFEPTRLSTTDFESALSASSSTGAYKVPFHYAEIKTNKGRLINSSAIATVVGSP